MPVWSGIGFVCCGATLPTGLRNLLALGGFTIWASNGAPGHGPIHLLMRSASELGFRWCSDGFCWSRTGLPRLPMVEGPFQHFKDAVFRAWKHWNSADLCKRKGVRGGPLLDLQGSMQLLVLFGVETRHC